MNIALHNQWREQRQPPRRSAPMSLTVPETKPVFAFPAAFAMPEAVTDIARQSLRMQAEMATAVFDFWLKPMTAFSFAAPAEAPKAPAKAAAPAKMPEAIIAPTVAKAVPAVAEVPPAPAPAIAAVATEELDEVGAPELFSAPKGKADDLLVIKGIGPKLARTLNDLGVWHYRQIAGWTPGEVAWINRSIGFGGRVQREDWQAQATKLSGKLAA
jgi:NADH-quinone oxidoreductase subunit E